jgi:hypothetical protein
MFYLTFAVLLAGASLMLDIASAWGKAVQAERPGSAAGSTSILPGLVFFPAIGCGLSWFIDRFLTGYGPWIVGAPVAVVTLWALGYYIRCRYLLRDKFP